MNERYELYKAVKWEIENSKILAPAFADTVVGMWNIINTKSDNEDDQYWAHFWKMACLDDYRKGRGIKRFRQEA